ncbi:hypothetical protein [Synoicihabitans lomoniglobus]|uniref:Uncharacterized protein n=1 Tax=Synoicihabitans lomoniglobus TaxID=2909285 RepID=A0AAF0CNR3_9BACT|nr:hypothetical protein [Opitutaceae bacterium LMO-M01]WED64881.1 hypothetical protein PXH66_21250 [Opitutaceae bacterium LMO-M01]
MQKPANSSLLSLATLQLNRLRVIGILAAAGWLSLMTGCTTVAPTNSAAHSITGRVISPTEIKSLHKKTVLGDNSYAEVNSAWLAQFNADFKSELHRLGITKWDDRFDCNRFTDLYRSLAQAHYFRVSFHRAIPAEALALGPIWYVRESSGRSHAIIQALTERGRVFIEPQTGKELVLSPRELRSTFFAAM